MSLSLGHLGQAYSCKGQVAGPIRRSRNEEIESSGHSTSNDLQGELDEMSPQILIPQGNGVVPGTLQA